MQGIIYKATNLKNNKVYIGQTRRPLKTRIKEHYHDSKSRRKYKFARALSKYKKEDWKWEILLECDISNLDNYEIQYIKEYNSFKKGYNSTSGGQTKPVIKIIYNDPIYELYRPDVGVVKGTKSELMKLHEGLHYISSLIKGITYHIHGFILASNKNRYNELLGIRKYYHKDYGIVECSGKELTEKYLNGKKGIYSLTSKRENKSFNGWILAENISDYDKIVKRIKLNNNITLEHPKYGTKTLNTYDFKNIYGLKSSGISALKSGDQKTHRGWKLVTTP